MTTTPHLRLHARPLHLGLFLAAAAVLPAACSIGPQDATSDVHPELSCRPEADGALRAVATVTNHSSKPSSYFIDIEFAVDGLKLEERTAIVESVDPGEVVPAETTVRDAPDGRPSCRITSIHRFRA
jgi:hypothetical protein